jgi:H+-transporting ATPase
MESKVAQPKAPESKQKAKPDSKDDLKSLLRSSPDGLTQAEAEKRLAQYGPNEIEEKKANPFLKFLTYFWARSPG